MMKGIGVVLVMLLLSLGLGAQQDFNYLKELHPAAGLRSREFLSPFACFTDPSVVASFRTSSLAAYGSRPFGLAGLSFTRVGASFLLGDRQGIALGVSSWGNHQLKEIDPVLAYGIALSPNWQIGVGIKGGMVSAPGYQGALNWLAMAGLSRRLDNVSIGAMAHYRAAAGPVDRVNGWLMALNAGKEWSGDLYSDVFIGIGNDMPVNVAVSLQYRLEQRFLLAFSWQSNPRKSGIETGWKKKGFGTRVTLNWYPVLGFEPGIGLVFDWTKARKS
ncbi:hypothetical protein KJS94_01045 [Flavihumibacter rivuli]|uniref:hypothetical protein n=1 Tax=Flavihumibacter rivuli TaxID=2838156 RepID=UPI001BDEE7EB|nr:hypothetical protein [Flavihumibacter rivuli]ULQ56781.1 hypothetical protein KJS94_01045 [Flavihumibacter rivuli]